MEPLGKLRLDGRPDLESAKHGNPLLTCNRVLEFGV